MVKSLLEKLPSHKKYIEAYGGGATLLLSKIPSPIEIYNDIDSNLTNLFTVARDHGDELRTKLQLTPYSEVEFNTPCISMDRIERARHFYMRCRQSMMNLGKHFRYSKNQSRSGLSQVVSAWLNAIDTELPIVIMRLRGVQIMCRSAVEILDDFDAPDTFFYLDPPYIPTTRNPTIYQHEMTMNDHRDLIARLKCVRGKVLLSGYDHPLYDSLGWNKSNIPVSNLVRANDSPIESIWYNYA